MMWNGLKTIFIVIASLIIDISYIEKWGRANKKKEKRRTKYKDSTGFESNEINQNEISSESLWTVLYVPFVNMTPTNSTNNDNDFDILMIFTIFNFQWKTIYLF